MLHNHFQPLHVSTLSLSLSLSLSHPSHSLQIDRAFFLLSSNIIRGPHPPPSFSPMKELFTDFIQTAEVMLAILICLSNYMNVLFNFLCIQILLLVAIVLVPAHGVCALVSSSSHSYVFIHHLKATICTELLKVHISTYYALMFLCNMLCIFYL